MKNSVRVVLTALAVWPLTVSAISVPAPWFEVSCLSVNNDVAVRIARFYPRSGQLQIIVDHASTNLQHIEDVQREVDRRPGAPVTYRGKLVALMVNYTAPDFRDGKTVFAGTFKNLQYGKELPLSCTRPQ